MRQIILIVAWQVLGLGMMAQAPEPPSPEQQLLKLVNMERRNANLPALQWDAKVAVAAQAHTQELANHRELSHQFKNEPDLTERVGVTGARFNALAENVAVASDAEEAHQALMNSPGHRANILNPEYNAVGIAVLRLRDRLYVTEDFARVVAVYSEAQFREAVAAEFNRIRRAKGVFMIEAHADVSLDQEACTGTMDPQQVLHSITGATRVTIFTATQPGDLPPTMEAAAGDVTARRMNIGVCFRTDAQTKVSKFWVVAAFYPTK